jgi:hypothetical protein
LARTSGGGVGRSDPRNEIWGVYCLVSGCTGPFGSSPRRRALISGGGACVLPGFGIGSGDGVGAISTGRRWAGSVLLPTPSCGPGEPTPLGPADGAVPAVLATTAGALGPGEGTPACAAGLEELRGAGSALTFGPTVAREIVAAVGTAVARSDGAGLGRTEGADVGAGGRGERLGTGRALGTGEGAAVGCRTDTAIGPTV